MGAPRTGVKPGRPTKYTDALADEICDRVEVPWASDKVHGRIGGSVIASRCPGRPTKYTDALADEICDRVEVSETGLARMLDEAPDLPCSKTIWTWMAEKPEFLLKVNAAKERQLEQMQYRGVELIDGVEIDGPNASIAIAQAKASAEARFKLASKIAPRRYGSQLSVKEEVDRRPIVLHFDAEDAEA